MLTFNRIVIIFGIFLFFHSTLLSQDIFENKRSVIRILFIVDGSGSMRAKWEGGTRFEIAKKLLSHVIDSIEASGDNVEFALRLFGHQYPKSANNCKDSKLEIPFGRRNAYKIKNKLNRVWPQGHTPIVYSLFLAMSDFPNDPTARNVIILITDGIENCKGDPCAMGEELQKRKITVKPFIIGLGLSKEESISFDCVGYYYDANTRKAFSRVLGVVISQALNNTTAQVNLIDQYGKVAETNVEMTFYDAFSGEVRYNLVHTLNAARLPDTIFLNPAGKYNLVVHTTPSVRKEDIELIPGKHNTIAVNVSQGVLQISMGSNSHYKNLKCLVRKAGSLKTMSVQDANTSRKYLTGKYDIEVLSIPRIQYNNVIISKEKVMKIDIPNPGILNITASKLSIASIYQIKDNRLLKVFELQKLKGKINILLQPGNYVFVYRPKIAYESELTRQYNFKINPRRTTYLNL